MTAWKKTACILCNQTCGVEVLLDGRRIAKVRGDDAHPQSQGYACEKAQRLDHHQNGRDRLTSPMRRRSDGTYEAIDWDTAIREVAERFLAVRARHGGESIFYYGGGGQGNHLGGVYGRATRAVLGSVYTSNALAQEKTGEFWVDGQLFGRPRCHTAGDFEHAEVAVFVGKNPWQSHGFPRARVVLKAIANDPGRALIVIDPRRTETAELADIHLQVRPGTDAFCLSALVAVLIQEELLAHEFLAEHANGLDELRGHFANISVEDYSARAGLDPELVRTAARRIARAKSVATFEDLGIQQAPHSTLSSYLEKLLYLLTGNFAKQGGMNIHTRMGSLGGGGASRTSPVGGHKIITGLIPANVIPDEILGDHPKRFRAMLVESANPAHSLADSRRMREALSALELLVVIDVAMTETARLAHYVLPACSQFEKWEATFFNLEFPKNYFHLRAPIFDPLPGTLAEPEIHTRLVRAMGGLDGVDLAPLHEAAAQIQEAGRLPFAFAFFQLTQSRPELMPLAPVILYETLGPKLVEPTTGASARDAAALWGAAHLTAPAFAESVQRAGFDGEGPMLGEQLFDAMLRERSGFAFTVDDYPETWNRVETPDKKIRLVVPDLMGELDGLSFETVAPRDPSYPFVLAAGERRSTTANTILRDPKWRKKDATLRISVEDATALGLEDGARVRLSTKRGSLEVPIEITDTLRPGHITLPNGTGVEYPDEAGTAVVHGPAPNELTATEDRDWLAGTPWHKHVPARLDPI